MRSFVRLGKQKTEDKADDSSEESSESDSQTNTDVPQLSVRPERLTEST